MRTFLALAVGLLVAGGIWLGFGGGEDRHGAPPIHNPDEDDIKAHPYLAMKTGTLVVRVKADDRTVPSGAQVGYEFDGKVHLYYADDSGRRELTDVPIGDIVVLAQAPGYREQRQRRTLMAGVPDEVVLELRPSSGR